MFLVGAALQCAATSLGVLYTGRIIAGIAIGVLCATVPLFNSELAPAGQSLL